MYEICILVVTHVGLGNSPHSPWWKCFLSVQMTSTNRDVGVTDHGLEASEVSFLQQNRQSSKFESRLSCKVLIRTFVFLKRFGRCLRDLFFLHSFVIQGWWEGSACPNAKCYGFTRWSRWSPKIYGFPDFTQTQWCIQDTHDSAEKRWILVVHLCLGMPSENAYHLESNHQILIPLYSAYCRRALCIARHSGAHWNLMAPSKCYLKSKSPWIALGLVSKITPVRMGICQSDAAQIYQNLPMWPNWLKEYNWNLTVLHLAQRWKSSTKSKQLNSWLEQADFELMETLKHRRQNHCKN